MTTVAGTPIDRNHLVHDIDRSADHPLRRLTAAEMRSARDVLVRAGLVTADTRFVYIGLDEPDKRDVRAYERAPSHRVDRRCRVHLLDRATGQGSRVTVSLTEQTVVSNTPVDPVRDGQLALLDEEFEIADKIVAADESWCGALRRRGIDPAKVIAAGLPAFTPHTITSPDVLRRKLSVIRLTQIATSRNEFECGKAAIAMPIFYGGGRVAAAIELAVRDMGSEWKPAAGALSVACHSLSRQLATEFRVTGNRDGHGTNSLEPALD